MHANDNDQNWKRCRYLHENWHQYDEIKMTSFGPIGVTGGEFQYLDPEIREWRA